MRKLLILLSIFSFTLFLSCDNSSTTDDHPTEPELANSMKGYELYSWAVANEWQFTLITGTNRYKSFAEVYSDETVIDENGWVKIRSGGFESMKSALGRLQAGEDIFWRDGRFLSGDQGEMPDIAFPESEIINEIKEYCNQLGLNLHI